MFKKFCVFLQFVIPQHLLSRLVGFFMNCHWSWLKNKLISWFIKHYHVDMRLAEKTRISDYATFNEFFTRKLKPQLRPMSKDKKAIICPVDGVVSQIGSIQDNTIIQAKKKSYTINELLAGNKYAKTFNQGSFVTLYLSPKDYHRIHIPTKGRLIEMIYVPGRLFSVNPATTASIDGLYAKNERVICVFETEFGMMVVILIGALLVGSIHTVWANKVLPNKYKTIQSWQYKKKNIVLKRGDELGHFELGSTVIVLFEPNKLKWKQTLQHQTSVKFGQCINHIN